MIFHEKQSASMELCKGFEGIQKSKLPVLGGKFSQLINICELYSR